MRIFCAIRAVGFDRGNWVAKFAALVRLGLEFVAVISLALLSAYLLVLLAKEASGGAALTFKDCMDIALVAIGAFGLGSLALLWKQLRDTSSWNKLLSYHQFFASFPSENIHNNLRDTLKHHGQDNIMRDKDAVLSADAAKAIYEQNAPDGSRWAVNCYLDEFEEFCAAIHCGLISEDYAYRIEGGRTIKNYLRFKQFIDIAQGINKRAFTQFQTCALRWQERRRKEDEAANNGLVVPTMAP